jgi:hypothetical protein
MSLFATFHVDVADVVDFGRTAIGQRRMVPITGGTVSGEIGEGIVLTGADWQWIQDDGTITLDAHYALKLDSGELVEVESRGTRFRNEAGEVVFHAAIRMSTSADRPDINRSMFIGNGVRLENQVILELHRVG